MSPGVLGVIFNFNGAVFSPVVEIHGAEVADGWHVGVVERAIEEHRHPEQQEDGAEEHSKLQQQPAGPACQDVAYFLGPQEGRYWWVIDHDGDSRGSSPSFRL